MRQLHHQLLGDADITRLRPASRRALLAGSARLAGAGALAVGFAGLGPGRTMAQGAEFAGDLDHLRRLHGVEQAAHALYRGALIRFTSDDSTSGDRLLPTYPTLARIRDQEQGHLSLLAQEIVARGGEPATPPTAFDFGYDDFAGFLQVAAEIEAASVAAYVGAVAAIAEPALRETVAGVLAVEARHAAYVNGRVGDSPFPSAVDRPRSPSEVLAATGHFVARSEAAG